MTITCFVKVADLRGDNDRLRKALEGLLDEIGSVGDGLSHGSAFRNDCEDWCKRIRDTLEEPPR